MSILVNCPTCRRELQIPDELSGRSVKCAECGTTFRAGGPVAGATVGDGQFDPGFPAAPTDERTAAARRKAVGPAVALIVVAILNLIAGLVIAFTANFARSLPDVDVADIHEKLVSDLERQNPGQPVPPEFKNLDEFRPLFRLFFQLVFFYGLFSCGVAVLTVMAATRAMKLRWLGFAKFTAVLAMIPLTSPCWMLGIIVGIWALIALNRPD